MTKEHYLLKSTEEEWPWGKTNRELSDWLKEHGLDREATWVSDLRKLLGKRKSDLQREHDQRMKRKKRKA